MKLFQGSSQLSLQKKSRTSGFIPGTRLLCLCIVISLLSIQLYAKESQDSGVLHQLKTVATQVNAPFIYVGHLLTSPIRGVSKLGQVSSVDPAQVQELEEQNTALRRAVEELEEYKQEALRLQGLLEIKSSYQLKSQAARVIGSSQDSWSRTITIDKGSAEGLALSMPVMNSYGLIGQIEKIAAHSATVRLISDENSGVSAMVQSSRAEGIVRGSADGSLRLDYVLVDAQVKKGDVIVTSGMGGVYPKGLPIGEVVSVQKDAASLHYSIRVKPPKAAMSYEEVLVITQLNDPSEQVLASVKQQDDEMTQAPVSAAPAEETSNEAHKE